MLYPVYKDKQSIVVIIDILRATSAICTAFKYGAKSIIPVATVEEARAYKAKGYMAGAERDAVTVDGFEFGNSPYSYMTEQVRGQRIVITTTNGTQAIEAAHDAYEVVIGSFLNFDLLCDYLLSQERSILLLCAGWKNKFNLEDALFAGAVSARLEKSSEKYKLGDASLAFKYLYEQAEENPYKFLSKSSHKERLARLNLKDDIRYCLTMNQTEVLPVLVGGEIVKKQT